MEIGRALTSPLFQMSYRGRILIHGTEHFLRELDCWWDHVEVPGEILELLNLSKLST
jgi:hypothetical protein